MSAAAPRTCAIAEAVFARFPDYLRGVLVAHGVHNGPSSPELVALLREAEASVRDRLPAEQITTHPRIASWRAAFKAQGINPKDFRCSVEAMARRALKSQQLPSINALVDIGNILSLRHLLPMGGHAIDHARQGYVLRPATGQESFVPFGSDQTEHPEPGEIIYAEGDVVLTRRWSWRQANQSLTLPETTAIEFNLDGLPPVTRAELESIGAELAELVTRHCGGRIRMGMLSAAEPSLSMEP
ncbi:MAG: phenylalanine--tRNA ligase beta subunit-related protein [Holophaga sp.]|nr:phenylalanine--tRNA ligase beta subunit-related protein [Holophaga sp.]